MNNQEISLKKRQWQTRLWIDRKMPEAPTTLYGKTIAELKDNIKQHILESSVRTSIRTTTNTYLYSDGSTMFPESETNKKIREEIEGEGTYKEGWYKAKSPQYIPQYSHIGSLNQLVEKIFKEPDLIEKGPDYKNPTIVDGTFQLAMIQITARLGEPSNINNALKRGWHLLKIDEENTYHLGHEDPDAI